MDDAVHVQIEIVKLNIVGIWLGRVNRRLDAIYYLSLFLDAVDDDRRKLPAQPTEKGRNSHGEPQKERFGR